MHFNRTIIRLFFFLISLTPTIEAFSQPNTIPNLVLWYAADSGVVLNGNQVSQWSDLSGNSNHAIQVNPGAQPVFVDSVPELNYHPVLRFDGLQDYMVFTEISDIRDCFFVIKHRTGTQVAAAPLLGHSTAYDFHSNPDTSLFHQFFASPYILNGIYELNGQQIPVLAANKPPTYSIISIYPTGNLTAEYITNDRNFIDLRFWDGDYVEIILYNDSLDPSEHQQVKQYLRNKYAPPVSLGPDTIFTSSLCPLTLDADSRFVSYTWMNSSADTNSTFSATSSGKYWVDVTDVFGFTSSDTVVVMYPFIQPALNNLICDGDTLLWDTNFNPADYSFVWSNSSSDPSLDITQQGQYYVAVTEDSTGCTLYSDTITVTVDSFPAFASLGNDTINLCIGNTIGLVQGADQASTYSWLPGGDTTSTLHIFTSGTYYLTVTDTNGCVKSDSIYANIVGLPPVANFLSTSVCEGAITQFTDSSYDPGSGNSIVSWFWDFGDGATDTLQNPSHVFQTAGTHTVILTATSNYGCPDNDTATVVVHPLPVASFINTNPCRDVAVIFNSTSTIDSSSSITNYLWNFGDPASGGNNTSSLQNPTHVYDSAANYVVSLITTSNFGCSDTAVDVIIVRPSSDPNFFYLPTCYGSLVQFQNWSTPVGLDSAWRWNFGDASGPNLLENPTHLYVIAQTYNVTLTVYAYGGCVTSATKPVTVSPLPVAAFVHSPACVGVPYQFIDSSYISSGSITGWEWHFTPTDSSSDQNPYFTFPDTGNYTITLKVFSNIGVGVNCTGSISRTIHVNPIPNANFSFTPQYGNPPLTVSFTNLTSNVNANAYEWDFGDGGTSTLIHPQHLYTDTSLFPIRLIATSEFGCKDTAQKNIYVIKPILDLAITGLSSTYVQDNHLHIIVDLANLGTRPINKFKIQSRLAEGTPVEESFVQTLDNGFSGQLELSASLDLGSGLAKYFCVSAVKPNDVDDDVLQNNEICKNLTNDFIVVTPYPNPFNDRMICQLILPYKDDISIEVFDLLGKKITIYEGVGQEGSNLFEADLSDLANGTYAVRFKFRESEIVKSVVKVERKN